METFTVDGKDTQLIMCSLSRVRAGATLHVLVHQDIEDFFRNSSKGMTEAVEKYGRCWGSHKPLRVWAFPLCEENRSVYTIWAPGALLLDIMDTDLSIPNISFLRLVGASQEGGITIDFDMLMSRKCIQETAKALSEACSTFYNDFIQNISIRISISKTAQ